MGPYVMDTAQVIGKMPQIIRTLIFGKKVG
jgi:hypothetical protein